MKNRILSHLPREYPWADALLCFDSIPSTNDYLKKLARENFAHLAPSKINVVLEYSHPPLSERIAAVEKNLNK